MPLSGTYEPGTSAWARKQAERYEASNGAEAADLRGRPIIVLTSIGAKTGYLRKTALMRVEHDGVYAVVGSQGGAPRHPLWYYNLKTDPHVELQDGPTTRDYLAREVSGDEKATWWARAVETWPAYAEYQTRTSRQIPVFVLEPTDPSARQAGMTATHEHYPLGAALTLDQLDRDPYRLLAQLREHEPVSWVPVLDGWLVTRRDLCIEVMRDAERYTVDDPRFSTAQVVGPSMLSLDGDEHRRHRDPFARAFLGPEARSRFAEGVEREARRLVGGLTADGRAEIRRDLAGPLAVNVVAGALELVDTDPAIVLRWYDEIVAAVDRVSTGGEIGPAARRAVDALDRHVAATVQDGAGVLVNATATLAPAEVVSNAAVMMFGGIETSEGMTTTLFWHLLTHPVQLSAVRADRSLAANAVEESLRLEPAAARVDRYATATTDLAGARIEKGDLVIVSLTAANRDPATFADPDTFDVARANARSHLAFAQGPHACVGVHLARLETTSALDAVLDAWPGLELEEGSTPPGGVIFRKPRTLPVRWAT